MKRCEGKIALVTGAVNGIGRGIALCLANEGADIAINDILEPLDAQEVLNSILTTGQKSLYCQADVSDRDVVKKMVANVAEHFGYLDICVANAGVSISEPVIEAEWEHVLHTLQITQFGVFHTCQIAAQQMVKQIQIGHPGGKIIIISSIHEELAVRNHAAYNMAKAAITQLGRTLAIELAPYKINVNVIHPGLIDTPGERSTSSEKELIRAATRIPWARLGSPEDIGKASVFLASEEADYITGIQLRVDGGFVLGLRFPTDD